MSRTQKDRNHLSSLKNSAQFLSNIIAFVIIYCVLQTSRTSTDEKTGPADAYRFRVSVTTKINFQCYF